MSYITGALAQGHPKKKKHKIDEFMSPSQFGFRPWKGTTDAIFIIRQIIEKAKEPQVKLHFNFVDLKLHLTLYGVKPYEKC